ncbi:Hsp20/alpha crystallin family protein [Lactiplantibacillus paraplantarum]|uniref:Hsp20/alpha crystallin family protein n=1 Tax=Lactiplantibacillus paraplantarum TaxID=60520 RepID=A0A4Q9Y2U6_9LACO|nr:Hsp20/alpha crystallin family protein [Lactiplantibacillus paraplantarum]MCT4456891.1 Hsp20/alpha crystallin family protein [Lactiplantibacillus paraplantarum]TBX38076.1 Hsp20/alpha crystallin family protein [Lactiplantibacillus paraplantarum]WEE35782.1 Hsp20/alpha crystallin family protein [Lactiplantibacillus paraplantarum]
MANDMMNWHNDLFDRLNDWTKMDDLVNGLGRTILNTGSHGSVLKTDIKENDDQYTMKVDVPGIDKQDIALKYRDGTLSIAVKRDSISDESDKDGNIIASERQTGRFGRQYALPDVDVDKIEARYENGVLQLTLPKKAAADTHHIEIQ